jgi:hypothetical protein
MAHLVISSRAIGISGGLWWYTQGEVGTQTALGPLSSTVHIARAMGLACHIFHCWLVPKNAGTCAKYQLSSAVSSTQLFFMSVIFYGITSPYAFLELRI